MHLKDVLESELLSAKRGFSSQKDELQTNLPLSPDNFSQTQSIENSNFKAWIIQKQFNRFPSTFPDLFFLWAKSNHEKIQPKRYIFLRKYIYFPLAERGNLD